MSLTNWSFNISFWLFAPSTVFFLFLYLQRRLSRSASTSGRLGIARVNIYLCALRQVLGTFTQKGTSVPLNRVSVKSFCNPTCMNFNFFFLRGGGLCFYFFFLLFRFRDIYLEIPFPPVGSGIQFIFRFFFYFFTIRPPFFPPLGRLPIICVVYFISM